MQYPGSESLRSNHRRVEEEISANRPRNDDSWLSRHLVLWSGLAWLPLSCIAVFITDSWLHFEAGCWRGHPHDREKFQSEARMSQKHKNLFASAKEGSYQRPQSVINWLNYVPTWRRRGSSLAARKYREQGSVVRQSSPLDAKQI